MSVVAKPLTKKRDNNTSASLLWALKSVTATRTPIVLNSVEQLYPDLANGEVGEVRGVVSNLNGERKPSEKSRIFLGHVFFFVAAVVRQRLSAMKPSDAYFLQVSEAASVVKARMKCNSQTNRRCCVQG